MMAKLDGVKTLDMVNGEITKVAYGGATYERVEGEAKAGDIALAIKSAEDTSLGNFYPVTDISHGDIMYMDDVDDEQVNPPECFRIFRKVAAATNSSVEERVTKVEGEIESLKSDVAALKGDAEPKPERLKVGDYAKVVGGAGEHQAEINDIVQVTFDDGGSLPFRCDGLNGKSVGWLYEGELVRATDEEVAEAKRAAAEAAERKKWAEIGREVGEYRKGDIVRVIDTGFSNLSVGDIGPISEIDESCAQVSARNLTDVNWVAFKRIELVTPVEARFDR